MAFETAQVGRLGEEGLAVSMVGQNVSLEAEDGDTRRRKERQQQKASSAQPYGDNHRTTSPVRHPSIFSPPH